MKLINISKELRDLVLIHNSICFYGCPLTYHQHMTMHEDGYKIDDICTYTERQMWILFFAEFFESEK